MLATLEIRCLLYNNVMAYALGHLESLPVILHPVVNQLIEHIVSLVSPHPRLQKRMAMHVQTLVRARGSLDEIVFLNLVVDDSLPAMITDSRR